MYVSDEYSELRQELKNGLVIDPPRFGKKFQNLAPMVLVINLFRYYINKFGCKIMNRMVLLPVYQNLRRLYFSGPVLILLLLYITVPTTM